MTPTPSIQPNVRHEILELCGRVPGDQLRTRGYNLPTGLDQRFHTYRVLRRCSDGALYIYGLSGQSVPSGMVLRPVENYCCVGRRDFCAGMVDGWARTVAEAPLPEGFCEAADLPSLIGRAVHTRDD